MTQEDKELLLKDLCGRLPYGVKIYLEDFPNATLVGVVNDGIILHCDKYNYTYDIPWDIEYIKPYLFPLSSMTEEQKEEYESLCIKNTSECTDLYGITFTEDYYYDNIESFDYLYKNHIDIRGLIEKGLAIDATGLNIY